MSQRLAFVGAGMMGGTLIAGLLAAGRQPADIVAVENRAERRSKLSQEYGIEAVAEMSAIGDAEVVVLAVKPQAVDAALAELAEQLPAEAVLVSLCAGISCSRIEDALPAGQPVVRVMPNTPAQVGAGAAAVSAGSAATTEQTELARDLLQTVGTAVIVPESYLDAVTALSGSGPAYLFLVAESLIESGVNLGLPRDIATELAVQTIFGSATLLRESGTHPALLREQVTSPGGTTAAGLGQLEEYRVRAAFAAATRAARDRSVELGG